MPPNKGNAKETSKIKKNKSIKQQKMDLSHVQNFQNLANDINPIKVVAEHDAHSSSSLDFNIHCQSNFKSEFARQLSLNNSSSAVYKPKNHAKRNGEHCESHVWPLPVDRVEFELVETAARGYNGQDNGTNMAKQNENDAGETGEDENYRPRTAFATSNCLSEWAATSAIQRPTTKLSKGNTHESTCGYRMHSNRKNIKLSTAYVINLPQEEVDEHGSQENNSELSICTQPQIQNQPCNVNAARSKLQDDPFAVERSLLESEITTLQWQLRQMEFNSDMYLKLLQDTQGFLERFLAAKDQDTTNLGDIHSRGRSLSLYHVDVNKRAEDTIVSNNSSYASGSDGIYGRARSSTSLTEHNAISSKPCSKRSKETNGKDMLQHKKSEEHIYTTIDSTGSYSEFKDYTLRRSPKKTASFKSSENPLVKEAFSLSRLIRGVLNTSLIQLDLTQNRSSPRESNISKASSASLVTLNQPPLLNSTSLTLVGEQGVDGGRAYSCSSSSSRNSPASLPPTKNDFDACSTMRNSHLSFRSSTDSSVYSTTSSSSKIETDEGRHSPSYCTPLLSSVTLTPTRSSSRTNAAKSIPLALTSFTNTEDESGFSSISSLQDLGIPFNAAKPKSTANQKLPPPPPPPKPRSSSNTIGLPFSSFGAKTNSLGRNPTCFLTLTNEDSSQVQWV